MALIENFTEDGEPIFTLDDIVRTALTPGDTDAMTLSGLTVGETYTLAITGLDPEAIYTLTLHNGTHGTSISTGVGGHANSMGTLFVTHDAGVMYVAFTVVFSGEYAMTFGQTGGAVEGSLVDIAVTQGNTLTFSAGDDYSSSAMATTVMDGMDGNDTIYGSSLTELLIGGDGDDFLYDSSGTTTVYGGSGNDTLLSRAGNDFLYGGDGDDLIQTISGTNVIHGGTGNDTIAGSTTGDRVVFEENSGNDRIENFIGLSRTLDVSALGILTFDQVDMADTPHGVLITFSPGNTVLLAGATVGQMTAADFVFAEAPPPAPDLKEITGSGQINGSAFADLVNGSALDDTIRGGDGNDQIYGHEGKDVLNGQGGDDLLVGGDGNDVLYGEDGNDTLDGGARNDQLNGGEGADLLDGGAGNDRLNGDAGDDTLIGGAGKDTLTGGEGADVFVFAAGSGRDIITDFEDGLDRLDLSALAGIAQFENLSIVQSGADAVITLSPGNGITLIATDAALLDATDFIFG